jgi:hypothetical protein
MEITMEGFDGYVEELRFKGVPVEDYTDVALMGGILNI